MDFIEAIEMALGRQAKKNFLPIQPGDVKATWADVGRLKRDLGYEPVVSVQDGVARFVEWYRGFYGKRGDSTVRRSETES